jgi:DNA-binding transcriptional ArsR family regulator
MLGTEANVRVLRVLSNLRVPVSASEIAKRAELQRSSVHRALRMLEESGIVAYVGTGVHSQIELRSESPLARPIRQLFEAEQTRYDELLLALKKTAASIEPPPQAVWIEGSVAAGKDLPADQLVLTVVDNSRQLASSTERLRDLLERVEKRFDVLVEVRGRSQADLEALSNEESEQLLDAISVLGVPPGGILSRHKDLWRARNIRAHGDHDERALAYGHALASAIGKDPSLVADARRYLARRWRTASAAERKELAEWRRILSSASPAQLRRLLTDPGERGTRLRQTIPFLGVFSAERPQNS